MTLPLVSIVGAGPGDPELLTLRALRRLRAADLVLHDALVSDAIVNLARRADRLRVGGRCGEPRMSQRAIEAHMIEAARAGLRVVRLKGGDPFVFGRGGEEAQALAGANIAFEVVPGLSSVLAGPLLAGIPVTFRGAAASFVVVNGHDRTSWAPIVAGLAPGAATLVVLMGLGSRGELSEALRRRGWPDACPAAIVSSVSTPAAVTWIGTLAGLATARVDAGPGILIIGEVVDLAVQLEPGSGQWQPSTIHVLSGARA